MAASRVACRFFGRYRLGFQMNQKQSSCGGDSHDAVVAGLVVVVTTVDGVSELSLSTVRGFGLGPAGVSDRGSRTALD